MSYYGQDQPQQPWHQHSQTTSYNTTNYSPAHTNPPQQQNGTGQQNGQPRQPIGPVLNQAVNTIVSELKSNMDKEYFKTTCGLLNCIEVIASLIVFIIATNLSGYAFLTLLTGFAFWISMLFLIVNLFNVPDKITTIPWTRLQFGFCAIASGLFIIETLILLFSSGILCLLVLHLAAIFGYHTYDKLKEIGRVVSEQQGQQSSQQTNLNANLNV